jgi:hypothetical protein
MVTIIHSPNFVIIDERCQLTINTKIIWRCNCFLELLKNPIILLGDNESRPFKDNEEFLSLVGWDLNVSSTVYSKSMPAEIINGWYAFETEMGRNVITRLLQPLFLLTIIDTVGCSVEQIRRKEPRIIELLRLSYWYYRFLNIDTNNTFTSKRKEIREKLTRAALTNIEKYKTTLKENDSVDNNKEFEKMINSNLIEAKEGKPIDKDFEKYIKELRKALWSVISELTFAGLCNDDEHAILFDARNKGRDYDFIVDHIPCQVKTIITEDVDAKQFFTKIGNRINELQNGKMIAENEIELEIKKILFENQGSITKSINQGAKILFINGTQTYAGFLLNQWASDNNLDLPIDTSLKKIN